MRLNRDKKNLNQTGIRVIAKKGVPPDVRRAILKFTAWLRKYYFSPIQLTIYLLPEKNSIRLGKRSYIANHNDA